MGVQVRVQAAAPCRAPSRRVRAESQGARVRPRGAWPGRGAPGAAQRPLMFANPGLSGGRGPSCWPNNRRLKGERGARGAWPRRPPSRGLPAAARRARPCAGTRARGRARTGPGRPDAGSPCRPSARGSQARAGSGPSRRRRRPLRSVTPAFSAAPGPAPAPR